MRISCSFLTAVLVVSVTADPIWPSAVDEMEDLMYLVTGYRARGFAQGVTPCSAPPAGLTGRTFSAEWIRSAFHDAIATNTNSGPRVGGADGSLQYELDSSARAYPENIGAGFRSALTYYANFFTRKSTAADLIALGLYTAVRSCGGPAVPLRVGRVDAAGGADSGQTPVPGATAQTWASQLSRLGLSMAESIQIVACGHSVGGVHSTNFPRIVPVSSSGADVYSAFDSTIGSFDNRNLVEYFANNGSDPTTSAFAQGKGQAVDFKSYSLDNNVTAQSISSPAKFATACAAVFQKMIEVVPAGVVLTDPLAPYEVKPSRIQLTLLDGGVNMTFAGEIRVRTTVRAASQIASVQLHYLDRTGAGGGTIMTSYVGTANGFDDNFAFFSFSGTIDATRSISAFNVLVNSNLGTTQTYNNGGSGYPVQDFIFLQTPQSCISATADASGAKTLTISAAVRNMLSAATLNMNLQTLSNVPFPKLSNSTVAMVQGQAYGSYSLFTATYSLPRSNVSTARLDLVSGPYADTFKSLSGISTSCTVLASPASNSSNTVSSSAASTSGSAASTSQLSSFATSVSSSSWSFSTSGTTASSVNSSSVMPSSSESAGSATSSATNTATIATTLGLPSSTTLPPSTISTLDSLSTMPTTSASSSSQIGTTSTSTSASAAAPFISSSSGWTNMGCYSDNVSGRALPNGLSVVGGSDNMTVEGCQAAAIAAGYAYAGLEYSRECWAGNSIINDGAAVTDGCNMACSGAAGEICGGGDRLSVYYIAPSFTTKAAQALPSGWAALGCYSDNVNGRALSTRLPVAGGDSNMTNANCMAAAQVAGLQFAGTEYAGECYGSSVIVNGGAPATDGCTMACNGAPGERCGGPNRLTVFNYTLAAPISATPVVAIPSGYHYMGCYTDLANNSRALANSANLGGNTTNFNCVTAAQAAGYAFAGTEYSNECYFGNELLFGNGPAGDGEIGCNMKCGGNSTEVCGGPARLTLYRLDS